MSAPLPDQPDDCSLTDADATDATDAAASPVDRLPRDARRVAVALKIASSVLAVPAGLVAIGACLGFGALAGLAGVALADGSTIARWIWLAVGVVGLVVAGVFAVRVALTVRAGRDSDVLATELLGLVDISALTTAVLADLAELTSTEGGLRALSRARALWRVLRRLDVGEHTAQFERARWFVPPEVSTTWRLAVLTLWCGLLAWVLAPTLTAAHAAGWL